MLDMEEWMDIKAMKRNGHSIREIVRRTGRAQNTVRKVLRGKGRNKNGEKLSRRPWINTRDILKKLYLFPPVNSASIAWSV